MNCFTKMSLNKNKQNDKNNKVPVKQEYVWLSIAVLGGLHILSLYGFWLILTCKVHWKTIIFNLIYGIFTQIGVTGGAHRLWSHRSFKAKTPLRIWLALTQAAAFQKDAFQWAREHRVHHKHTDTDADPHNSTRGFFFCHMGWLFMKKHPEVTEKGKLLDLSDVASDPVIKFQRKYYFPLVFLLTFFMPSYVPVYFWKENLKTSFFICIARYILTANATGSINSFAHMYGYKPYDKTIRPAENKFVSTVSCGEGWHNYHHSFPWDYKAAELGNYGFNFTTAFLDLMYLIGQAYDLKTVSKDMVRTRVMKKGDGSWTDYNNEEKKEIWGWGDADMNKEDMKFAQNN